MLRAGLCPGWERDSAVLGTAGDEGKEMGMERMPWESDRARE